jgi:dCTP deaminase
MILCDREAELAMDQNRLLIHPRPDPAFMDSTAIDLCLGDTLDRWEFPEPIAGLGHGPHRFCPGSPDFVFMDLEKQYTKPVPIPPEGYELLPSFLSTLETGPRHFILGWTRERIYLPQTSRLCARVEGKSSLGRMGLGVHVTAPTIHAGFGYNKDDPADHGAPLRLEIWNVGPLPIVLAKGMRICQLILEEVREVPKAGYGGGFNLQGPSPKDSPPPSAVADTPKRRRKSKGAS